MGSLFNQVYMERYGDAYRELVAYPKHYAERFVNSLVKRHLIVLPKCEYAGCTEMSKKAYYPDYDEALAVVWLCTAHHRRLSAQFELDHIKYMRNNYPWYNQ